VFTLPVSRLAFGRRGTDLRVFWRSLVDLSRGTFLRIGFAATQICPCGGALPLPRGLYSEKKVAKPPRAFWARATIRGVAGA